jgi:hypothetical protein
MRIVITEVTDMLDGRVCVAGWATAERRMVRPLAGPGRHWPAELATPRLLAPGNLLELAPSRAGASRGLPHAREDLVVADPPSYAGRLAADSFLRLLRSIAAPDVATLFAGTLEGGRFVMAGRDCPSLGGVTVEAARLSFSRREGERGPQPRCRFVDASGAVYDLPLVGHGPRAVFAEGGIAALQRLAAGPRRAHLRLGLAHPSGDGMAFAMVNNIVPD